MPLETTIKQQLEKFTGDRLVGLSSLGGGCIADSRVASFKSGQKFFVKIADASLDFIKKEAKGLIELGKSNTIRIPKVIAQLQNALVLEWIETAPIQSRNHFFNRFGKQFAKLHLNTGANFGFFEDNLIGSNPQINLASNLEKKNWYLFYKNKRLDYQMKLAEEKGYLNAELENAYLGFLPTVKELLTQNTEPPSLLHGDLWGGNYLCDSSQNPVLIDPAVYYGHREADLAMTKLFGGFDRTFYSSYLNAYPLNPGYHEREGLYLLYHVLNHMNLFGTGYRSQAIQLMMNYQ